jgi:hypothetical protein
MKLIEFLSDSVRSPATAFNPEVQAAPVCVLWPDKDGQWEAVIPRLQGELPELLVLGDYAPEKRTGPAIWLRCVIAGEADDVPLPQDRAPVLYLPGVSRQDLRAVESCPDHLKALAELQYRGAIWSQLSAKDWTILAFLKSDQGGLGLDVAQDNGSRNAMQLALHRLLDEDIDLLQGKRLDRDYFNTLLTGGDPVRDLLQWLDQGDAFRAGRGANEWQAFCEVCKSQLAFDPQNDGMLAGAAKLADHSGPWQGVWERFCEAPTRYPGIPAQFRKCKAPMFDLFADTQSAGGWPQWNEEQEAVLRRDLLTIGQAPPHEGRKKLLALETKHGARRALVWAELGEAPLAQAVEHLAVLAGITTDSLAAGTVEDMAAGYRNQGWRADDAVIRALSCVTEAAGAEAVATAVQSVYLPWAEESARHLQKTWQQGPARQEEPGGCILFVDGLRFDCAKRLALFLEDTGCEVQEDERWAALPSVTGTGKPAVSPICRTSCVADEPEPSAFDVLSPYQFDKALKEAGWLIVRPKDAIPAPVSAPPATYPGAAAINKLWVEFGDIDHEGHDRGWKLAKHIDVLLAEIRDRITALLDAGWERVRVVTDHGWLLLPGGLPKIDLPSALTESKWGRCASLKAGATTKERLYPWFWNPSWHFALADGISCFKKGEEYAHGGLSLQECLTLQLTVSPARDREPGGAIVFTDVVWKGLRCTVAVAADDSGLSLDLRTQPGNRSSSVILGGKAKPFKGNGTASVVVDDEDLEGHPATLVVLDASGGLLAQDLTTIGGGDA